MSLEDLGQQAYQKAKLHNDFKGAVEILNKAIGKYPSDKRLYNNRSYCYNKLGKYDKALEDATFMVRRFPDYIKSHYRKGEALFSLNNLVEAEKCFQTVLKMDRGNEEALAQLINIQTERLGSGKNYPKWQIEKALVLAEYDSKVAAYLLENGGVDPKIDDEIYVSDDDIIEIKVQPTRKVKHKVVLDPFTDPINVYNCPSIWIGNVTKNFTEDSLRKIFSEFGKIKSMSVHYSNTCAFVNYMDPSMASKAMKLFQSENHPYQNLVVRFPDNAAKCKPKPNLLKI